MTYYILTTEALNAISTMNLRNSFGNCGEYLIIPIEINGNYMLGTGVAVLFPELLNILSGCEIMEASDETI